MKRNYVAWYKMKAGVEKEAVIHQFHTQEIWWCVLGANVGDEQDGKNEHFERPVLVLRKYNKNLFFGLPMTSSQKQSKFYFPVIVDGVGRSVMLSQGRTLSGFRLLRKIYKLNDNAFADIERAYVNLTLEKTISAGKPTESPVPSGSLYLHGSNIETEKQIKGGAE